MNLDHLKETRPLFVGNKSNMPLADGDTIDTGLPAADRLLREVAEENRYLVGIAVQYLQDMRLILEVPGPSPGPRRGVNPGGGNQSVFVGVPFVPGNTARSLGVAAGLILENRFLVGDFPSRF